MKKTMLYLCCIILISSCGQRNSSNGADEGKLKDGVYTSELAGWTIKIPAGWEVINRKAKAEIAQRGKESLEDAFDEKVGNNAHNALIAFGKTAPNTFLSTIEPFSKEDEEKWDESISMIKKMLYTGYLNQGIPVDTTSTTTELIDRMEFKKFTTDIYSPGGKIEMSQTIYCTLIDHKLFAVNINYDNEADRDEMLEAFRNSTFKR